MQMVGSEFVKNNMELYTIVSRFVNFSNSFSDLISMKSKLKNLNFSRFSVLIGAPQLKYEVQAI